MSLVFNMVGGAGGSAELPAIYVTYPEGSVCTCSNGTKTYTAKDTSGYWLFAGLDIATWIVTATDGTETASETVEITSEGQNVSVVLSYVFYLYNNGNQYTGITGGWKEHDQTSGNATIVTDDSITFMSTSGRTGAITSNAVDLTGYSNLKATFEVTVANNKSSSNLLAVIGCSTVNSGTLVNMTTKAEVIVREVGIVEVLLDISNVNGNVYVVTGVRYYDITANLVSVVVE